MISKQINSDRANILVVDDVRANLRLLAGILAKQGYIVRPVPNGLLALAAAQADPPDLILLDINMPDMNGYQVCQRLKASQLTHDIPIIFISALDQTLDKVKAFSVGGVDYITKPFQVEEVLARVKTHLMLRLLNKKLQESNNELERRVAKRTAELAQLNAIYERFVPREFLAFLQKKSILDVRLGDQIQQELTIVFSDIRGFTSLSEKLSPQGTFEFINEYLAWVTPTIREYNGFIDKYIGDAVMALFPEQGDHAIQAAIAMQDQITRYNVYRKRQQKTSIQIGIGIHTGSLMLGIIGQEERMQGTVISDAVNLASRLESLTKQYAASLIISEQTLASLSEPSKYNFRFLGKVQVKGKKLPVSVFEILDAEELSIRTLKLQTKAEFEKGMRLYYERQFAEASVEFYNVLKSNPKDKVARLLLERAAHYMVYGVPADWANADILTEK